MTARTATTRKIVRIDQDKCNGCGQCVPSCAEGAIRIIDGKARLVADNLCDGLGACLGECPQNAIRIEERTAEEFDETAVARQRRAEAARPAAKAVAGHHAGCPGAALRSLEPLTPAAARGEPSEASPAPAASKLRQWPIQLALLPTEGPIWRDADVLLAADCVAFAMPGFHERFVGGRTVAIACPKLDDAGPYVEKLAAIFAGNAIRSITIAHMEVPCCFGLERIARMALEQAGKDIPLDTIEISIRGDRKAGIPAR